MSSPLAFVTRSECPACASIALERLYSCDFAEQPISAFVADYFHIDPTILSGARYDVKRCLECATMFQSEVGNDALLTRLYSEWVFHIDHPEDDPMYHHDVHHPNLSRDGHELMVAAAFLGKPITELSTLDYGMGWACWSRIALMLGCESFGYDLADERMAFAAQHGVRTDIAGRKFDFINTEQVFEHLTDPAGATERFAAMLKPGGVLKISVPSQARVAKTLDRLKRGQQSVSLEEIMPLQPLEHVNCFSPRGLEQIGARFGLRPVRPSYRQRFAFLGHPRTLDVRKPARTAKELLRPWYQWRNPTNLYLWLQLPRG